jgi:hypothetical protein
VDAPRLRVALVLLLGAAVLCGAAWSRGAEYDEQYTVFLLAGDARPVWPGSVFTADAVRDRFHGNASPLRIAADLRRHDVHPPLYFWAASAWSLAVGDTLFRLRLFSVLCGLAALATVGRIARRIGVPAALAMLVTLGCYTGSIARGFALAQLLALLGVWAALVPHQRHPRRRPGTHAFFAAYAGEVMDGRRSPMPSCLAAGLLLGAASFANYLAAFTAIPVLVWLAWRRLRDGVLAASGFAVFVAADLVFFLAQRDSRAGQFPPFHLGDGLLRLGKYAAAGVAGGLPLYAPASLAAPMTAATAIVLGLLAVAVAVRWRRIATPSGRALLAGCVIATPAGLLALGLIFDNTPIELRYLAFATPYAALLLAGALADRRWPTAAVLTLQAAAIAGLLLRPEGNDGVGLVGAFIASAPGNLRLMLAGRDTQAAALHGVAPRLAVALLDRDADSHATLTGLLAGFADDPCWRALPGGFNLIVFQSTCGDAPWVSSTASR